MVSPMAWPATERIQDGMTMPHVTAQVRSMLEKHDEGRTRISKTISEGPKSSKNVGLCMFERQQIIQAATGAYSPSTAVKQSPRKRKFNILLTPSSFSSAVFDTPIKQSPSSSLSPPDSAQSFAVIKRGATPIAELEDTSRGSPLCSELEDTSVRAMSSSNRKIGALTPKSYHPTSQALVIALDRQFADYEEEIRQLRRELFWKEESLILAQKTTGKAQSALSAAKKAIAEQELVIEQLALLNVELEKEVTHCQKHHLPPPTPSKSSDLDVPVSLFNPDANLISLSKGTLKSTHISSLPSNSNHLDSCLESSLSKSSPHVKKHSKHIHVSASLAHGSPFINNHQIIPEVCSPSSKDSSPKSLIAAASPIAKSPSAAGSPYTRPSNPVYNSTPRGVHIPLALEALYTVEMSSSAFKPATILSDNRQFTPLGYIPSACSDASNLIGSNDSHRPKSKDSRPRKLRTHSSSPSLHLGGPLSPYNYIPHVPPIPAVMRGGLTESITPTNEKLRGIDQDHTLRKKLNELGNGFSDLFRAKE